MARHSLALTIAPSAKHITIENGQVKLDWSDSSVGPAYQVEGTSSLDSPWHDLGNLTMAKTKTLPLLGDHFWRARGQVLVPFAADPINQPRLTWEIPDTMGDSIASPIKIYTRNGPEPAGQATDDFSGWALAQTITNQALLSASDSTPVPSNGLYYKMDMTTVNGVRVPHPIPFLTNVAAGNQNWIRTIQSSSGQGQATILRIATDSVGSVIAVGWFIADIDLGYNSLPENGFIAKYNASGTLLWSKHIACNNILHINSIVIDSSDNIIISGPFTETCDFSGTGAPNATKTSTGGTGLFARPDIYVAKYNSSGVWQWVVTFGGNEPDTGQGLALFANGDIAMVAKMQSSGTVFGAFTLSTAGVDDVVVAKLSGNTGSVIWAVVHGSTDTDQPMDVCVNRVGVTENVNVCGLWWNSSSMGGPAVALANQNLFVAQYSGSTGAYIWQRMIGGPGGSAGFGIGADPASGNIIVTGAFRSGSSGLDFGDSGAASTLDSGVGGGVFVVCYSPSGAFLWGKATAQPGDGGRAVAIISGKLLIAGVTTSSIYFGVPPALNVSTQPSYFASKFDFVGNAAGVNKWNKMTEPGSSGSSNGFAAAFDALGHAYTAGTWKATGVFGGIQKTSQLGSTAAFLIQYSY